MQQQKLCLKWHNHTVNFLSEFQSYRQKDVLVDVTISCEGRNIKAHKMILSACSPYFQTIFSENPCQHPIVIINGMKYEDIMSILSFMYKGEVNVSHEGLSSFLQAAEALKVKGLAEVCGENKKSATSNKENELSEPPRPQRTETPNKKRHRNRKRSLSDDEGGPTRRSKEPSSPEIHELSGDEAYVHEERSLGKQQMNSRRPQNMHHRSHPSSNVMSHDEDMDDDYDEIEPSKLLEQTLTTENVSTNNSDAMRIDRIVGSAPEVEPTSIQEPESPPDIKPIVDFGESSAGASEVFNEQSQPGPSNIQEITDNSPSQGSKNNIPHSKLNHCYIKKKIVNIKKMKYECTLCEFAAWNRMEISQHLKTHAASRKLRRPNVSPIKSPSKTFSCIQCSYKTKSEKEISNHLLLHANNFHVCGKCRRRFNSKEILIKHQNNFHQSQTKLSETAASTPQSGTKPSPSVEPSVNIPVSKKEKSNVCSLQGFNSKNQNFPKRHVAVAASTPKSITKPSHSVEGSVNIPVSEMQNNSSQKVDPKNEKLPKRCVARYVSKHSQKEPTVPDSNINVSISNPSPATSIGTKSKKPNVPQKKAVGKSSIVFLLDPHSSGNTEDRPQSSKSKEETLYPCCYCNEVFASSFGLTCHKENIHKYKCNYPNCSGVFLDPEMFEAHVAEHEKQKMYRK